MVLGMIGLGARSGYDVKQMVQLSIRFFWTISQAQIYPSVRRLEAAGLITGRDDPGNKRRPRTFHLTAAGRRELRSWITRPEPMPFELRDIAMVKLFFAGTVQPGRAHQLLNAVRHRSQQCVATLQAIEPSAAVLAATTGNDFPQLTAHLGIAYHQAIVDTCNRFELHHPLT